MLLISCVPRSGIENRLDLEQEEAEKSKRKMRKSLGADKKIVILDGSYVYVVYVTDATVSSRPNST